MICERAITTRIEELFLEEPGEIKIRGRPVQITTTACNFGGSRFWFLCPACGRRCAILYPVLCRKCQNGQYEMESKSTASRKVIKAIKLREKLGQTNGGIVAPIPPKPKWMRWHTYLRIRTLVKSLEKEIWAADRAKFSQPKPRKQLLSKFDM